MHFEQFYLTCLAHASYLFGSEGEAAVVDPQRDVEIYLRAAEEHGLRITHIFETHLHADFVSGHRELARHTGAQIYVGRAAGALFPHVPLDDGMELRVGSTTVRVLGTPGHTLESVCYLLTDPERGAAPFAALTGDTLFIGDVGRPDLSRDHTPQELAGMLYDSLHAKLLTLPDEVLVYPAHGAGSLCGRNLSADKHSTIGAERRTNYALQIRSRAEFVAELTRNLPVRPEYFLADAEINRTGAEPLGELPPLAAMSASEVAALAKDGALVLDTRAPADFRAGHIAGAINVSLGGQFASWAGIVLGLHAEPILVAESDAKVEEARMRLSRVGMDEVRGYLAGGMDAWGAAGLPVVTLPEVTPAEAAQRVAAGWQVLDVRRQAEWEQGHIAEAHWHALDDFRRGLPRLDRVRPVAVHCKSGYRSSIACSLLQREGYDCYDVLGGFDGWQKDGLPVVAEQTAVAGMKN
jgi:glyoxylase-like metal-dependent hydrolase (beta-lactamase superfamily II)/rhodanese-related sulfurtransferase